MRLPGACDVEKNHQPPDAEKQRCGDHGYGGRTGASWQRYLRIHGAVHCCHRAGCQKYPDLVANKIRSVEDEEFVRSRIPAEDLLGFIHYNTEVIDADRQGKAPYDVSQSATDEIRKIKAILDQSK